MPLINRKVLTFDVVGTLIDFETGILDYVQGKSKPPAQKLSSKPTRLPKTASITKPRACPSPR